MLQIDLAGLGLEARGPGKLLFGKERELTESEARGGGIYPQQTWKAMRQTHHRVARLLAQGMKQVDVSRITGMAQPTISLLSNDPTFKELLTHYSAMEQKEWEESRADMHQRLAAAGFDGLEILHERLLDNPEKFSVKELLSVVELTADRTGYGKVSTVNANVSHSVDPEVLARIRANAGAPALIAEEDRRALLGLAQRATESNPTGEAPAWIEGEGHLVREEGGEGTEAPIDSLRAYLGLSPVDPVS